MRPRALFLVFVLAVVGTAKTRAQPQSLTSPDYSRISAQTWIDQEVYSMIADSARLTAVVRDLELRYRSGWSVREQAREALWLSWSLYRRFPAGTPQERAAEDAGSNAEVLLVATCELSDDETTAALQSLRRNVDSLDSMIRSQKVPVAQPTPKPPPKPPRLR